MLIRMIERVSGRARFERIYDTWRKAPRNLRETVFTSAIGALGIRPEARDVLLPIDFGSGPEARRISAETRRQAVNWLDRGHALIIFPGGGVATSVSPWRGRAADLAWHPFVARLARRSGVRRLTMFVQGQNSRLFQWVSHFSCPLRVALIFRETRRVLRHPVKVAIADPVFVAELSAPDMVTALRERCFAMAPKGGPRADMVFDFPERIRF